MDNRYIKNVVEAALLAAERPLEVDLLRDLFEEYERPPVEEIRAALSELTSEYAERALELVEVSSGWRAQVRSEYAAPVSKLWQERPTRYSRALLETLALIAYRQPITRGEIEDVRGVAVNPNIIRTLSERGWIRTVGHREVPGRPELLGTTREFLDYFGLKSLDALPTLAELKDMDNVGVQLEFGSASGQDAPAAAGEEAAGEPEAAAAAAEVEPTILEGAAVADGAVAIGEACELPEAANDPEAAAR
jgi:segregation and condensation protein B